MIFEKIKQNKAIPKIIFVMFLLLQLMRIIYTFAFLKQDYHPDETWSFGLANSYYEPYIYQDADETCATHTGFWFSTEELKKYLTVDTDHRFSYDSVWYNQSKDLHPPLFYAILHTLCSFFPEKFSFWFGFVINIVAFIGVQFYLYRLSKEVTKSDIIAVITCSYFGFTSGALCIFIFVRMYALATMFATISAFYHARLYNDNNLKRNLPIIFFITLAGALTHHYYLVYAGALSACFCIYYLFKRKFKYMVIYASALLLSVGTSILIFPATIHHAFGRRGKINKLPVEWQSVMSLNCVSGELTGIQFKIGKTPGFIKLSCLLILVLIIVLPLWYLFRKDLWFIKFKKSIKNFFVSCFNELKIKIKGISFYPVFLLVTSSCVWIVVFLSISMIGMGNYTDRYLFVIYPSCCFIIVYLLSSVLRFISKNIVFSNVSLLILCMVFVTFSNLVCPCIYILPGDYSVRKNYKGADIIYITEATNLLTQISKNVLDSEMIYMDKPSHFINSEMAFAGTADSVPVYLLLDESCLVEDENNDDDVLNDWLQIVSYSSNKEKWSQNTFEKIVKNKNPYGMCEYVGRDFIAGYSTLVYKLR